MQGSGRPGLTGLAIAVLKHRKNYATGSY